MAEKYDDIREIFCKYDASLLIDDARKQETLEQLQLDQKAQAMLSPGRNRKHLDFAILKYQFCYMDKTILFLHLAVCLGIIFLGRYRHWDQIAMIVSGVLGALSLLEVGNLFFAGMTELGESCYFNVRQLTAFQMVYSGVISLAALMITTVSTGLKYQLDIIRTGLYILVPFVFTEWICLTVMISEAGRRNLLLLIAAGIFSGGFWAVLSSIQVLYESSALVFWGMALLAGTGMLAMQVRRFFNALDKGEILCAD